MLHKIEIRLKKKNLFMNTYQEKGPHHTSELIIRMGDISEHIYKNINGFQGVHGGFSIGERNQEGCLLLEFCDAKHLCIANTWLRKADKKKITYSSGCNECDRFLYNGKSRSHVS